MSQFKESQLPCYPKGTAYETAKHSVVFYEYSTMGGILRERKHWRAYTRPDGMYVDGDKEYTTREEAEAACCGAVLNFVIEFSKEANMIPGLSRNDMVAIMKREERTENRLEKALTEIERLKAIIKKLRGR